MKNPQKAFGLPTYHAGDERLRAPKSLAELETWAGPLGKAAAERATWGAVVRWLNERPNRAAQPRKAAHEVQCVLHYMQAQAAVGGIPTIKGEPLEAEYLSFHRSRQSRVKKTSLALLKDWQAAGEPCLDVSISYTAEYMRTALKQAATRAPAA